MKKRKFTIVDNSFSPKEYREYVAYGEVKGVGGVLGVVRIGTEVEGINEIRYYQSLGSSSGHREWSPLVERVMINYDLLPKGGVYKGRVNASFGFSRKGLNLSSSFPSRRKYIDLTVFVYTAIAEVIMEDSKTRKRYRNKKK